MGGWLVVLSHFLSPSDPDQLPPTDKPERALSHVCRLPQRRGAQSPEMLWLRERALQAC